MPHDRFAPACRRSHQRRLAHRPTPLAALAVAGSLAPLSALSAPMPTPPLRIALSGTAAPAGGGNYASFSQPVLNAAGQVAFTASLSGGTSTQGLFAGAPAALAAAALQGTASPAGGNYNVISAAIRLNAAGQVAFQSSLSGGPASGIFVGAPGSIQAAAISGTAAPVGGNYGLLTDPSGLNAAGQVSFVGFVGSNQNPAIFVGAPGSLKAAAVAGTSAPAGGVYNAFVNFEVINASGRVAFAGFTFTNQGIYTGLPGAVQAVAVNGTPAPAGGNYASFGPPLFNAIALNDAGQMAFVASLSGGTSTQGLFAGIPGALVAAALQNSAAPAGGNYSNFRDPVLNGAGQLAFFANLAGGGSGLFAGTPGAIQAVALAGSSAPAGGAFTTFNTPPSINATGQVAFVATLTGTDITAANDTALFAGPVGGLLQIVREGDVLDVDPGIGLDNRTVAANGISFGPSPTRAKNMTFNDDSLLVYTLTFTDGSSGVFTSTVPEPTGLLALAGIAAAALRRRRRQA